MVVVGGSPDHIGPAEGSDSFGVCADATAIDGPIGNAVPKMGEGMVKSAGDPSKDVPVNLTTLKPVVSSVTILSKWS